ncbi:MAG: DUF2207 domain-containing protein [Actinobacteria bacterium]|nr:DUF2207 domain-containing protein [Actinomycetota bacterium]
MTLRRRTAAALVLVVVSVATVVVAAAPADAQRSSERITEYDVELVVEDDGDLLVEETVVYDFGASRRRGIFRDIPVRGRYDDVREGFDRIFPLEVLSVSASAGTPADYEVQTANDTARIRIGDPNRTITGSHTYRISYRVRGVLNGFENHDELYWNAVGAGWGVPIEQATARVELPGPVGEVACFAGPVRSISPCDESGSEGDTATFSHSGLRPRQAFTVVVGFPTGIVPTPEPILEERWSMARAFSLTPATLAGFGILLVAALAWVARLVWRTGRDRRWIGSEVDIAFGGGGDGGGGGGGGDDTHAVDQVVPLLERHRPPVEFVPPDGIRPGQMGTLIDEVAHPLDVTATIIDLAVRGYLRIEELPAKGILVKKPDWEIVRTRGPEGLSRYETLLFDGLFEKWPRVKVSELSGTFTQHLRSVQNALYLDVKKQGWFTARPDHVREHWLGVGAGVLVIGAILVALAAWKTTLAMVPVPVVVAGVLLIAGARWMPRRTAKGTGTLRRVLGFRRFIDESEAERAQFAERQHLFSEYLPYAVVFGATEKWAKAFAGLDGALPEMGWYASPDPFTFAYFASSINGFSVTTAGTLTSAPAGSGFSSGGGFSGGSGFGGGGFSGGGMGGGGGGSW